MNPPRSEEELFDIYGRENVRVHQNRLQVQEEHFHQPGGRVLEWVEADMALPPADPSDLTGLQSDAEVVLLDDPVPDMTEEDYAEAKEDEEDDEE